MKIAIGSDHAGYALKESIVAFLKDQGHDVKNFGPHSAARTDYPKYGRIVGQAVASGEYEKGIVICGTGIGISISANKVPGVRCALCSEPVSAALSVRHNNANMLAMGARMIGEEMAREIVRTWLEARFEGGRHADRVHLIGELDGSCPYHEEDFSVE
ncbi:MAG: ribose 5-phosphate isomerase B [Peptoniphilaceae bacterium]|nr:ribose 5-phosphate isomerase B [Peptoniphilaceae bacterium]